MTHHPILQIIMQVWLYRYYGDTRILTDSYNATSKWVSFIEAAAASSPGLIEGGLSDWMSLEHNMSPLTGRVFFYLNLKAWGDINRILGHDDIADTYALKALAAGTAVNTEFLDPATGVYAKAKGFNGTQCGQAMPLYYGLVPNATRPAVVKVLMDALAAQAPTPPPPSATAAAAATAVEESFYESVSTADSSAETADSLSMKTGMFLLYWYTFNPFPFEST